MISTDQRQDLAACLAQALNIFVELTGVDPRQKMWTTGGGEGVSSYAVSNFYKQIEEALKLDKTNITAYLLLDTFSSEYLRGTKFSIDSLLDDVDRTTKYIDLAREFRSLVRAPEVVGIGEDFSLSMRQALRNYYADQDRVMAVLDDRDELAYLRRDALKSMEKLRVDQFLVGEPDSSETPAYNNFVHQFWNINSLINAACHQPSGVTLNLIRTPDDYQSYFAFAIRNGGNLFILSDVPEHSHPLQKYMSRRPDRAMERRIEKNWFPYELMDIKFNEENERIYFDHSHKTGMIPLNQQADMLKSLAELEPRTIIWVVMMFDLIVDRFWHKRYQAPALSYTGQMIKEATPLIDEADKANLPVTSYQPLTLPALTVNDIKSENIRIEAVGQKASIRNQWMEDRYGDQVNDEVLNLTGFADTTYFLTALDKKMDETQTTALVSAESSIMRISTKEDKRKSYHREGSYQLHALESSSFGSQEEMENNREYIARFNFVKSIQRLADAEFKMRRKEIEAWWSNALKGNIDFIHELAVNAEIWKEFDKQKYPGGMANTGMRTEKGAYPYVKRYYYKEMSSWISRKSPGFIFSQGIFGGKTRCHINGVAASMDIAFSPSTPEDLAILAECKVSDLPDVLQHWVPRADYMGNHILDRRDPLDWAIKNPWAELHLNFDLSLSFSGLKTLEKRYKKIEGVDYESLRAREDAIPNQNDEASIASLRVKQKP